MQKTALFLADEALRLSDENRQLKVEIERLRAETQAENERLRRCLGFFASVSKGGEPWTATCQQEYDAARKGGEEGGETKPPPSQLAIHPKPYWP